MSTSQVDEMEGIETTHGEETRLMTEDERRVLDVYDRLEELQLEIALLKAQGVLSQDASQEASEENIKVAERGLLSAKAAYQVRTNVVLMTLVANPVIQAVHAGSNASIVEQDLLPLIQKRDDLSVTLSGLSTKVLAVNEEIKRVESEHIVLARTNTDLSAQMLDLAAEANKQKKGDISSPKVRQQLEELEVEMKTSRQRWRIMKGTASATIAGSGVDWSRSPELLEIVLDKEGEDG